jgi:hypothetical protein
MAVRKPSGFCRALLLAASATAIFMATARAQTPAEELSDLNARILEDPQDDELNLTYARIAEQSGKLRLALAAYERVLINDPGNEEAQRGFARVRRVIEPPFQTRQVEIGARWDSNPLQEHGSDEEAVSAFAHATLVDERRIGAHRWRTVARLDGEVTPDFPRLNYGYVSAQTGPVVDVAPNLAAIPSVGVAAATLDNSSYLNEVNASVSLEGQHEGVSFWGRVRANWRDYSEESTADQGPQVEVSGGVTAPRVLSSRDSLAIVPWVRWSDVEGSSRSFLDEEVAPGEYTEIGLDAAYHYRVNDNLSVSWGVIGYRRDFARTEIAGQKQKDTYVAPQVTLTAWNVLPCSCALRFNYRHRDNDSNDPVSDYEADEASVSLFVQW